MLNQGPAKPKEALGEGLASHHHTTKRMLSFKKMKIDDIEQFRDSLERALNDVGDVNFKNGVIGSYLRLYKHYHELVDEEVLINRMERKAQIRNVIFRGVTTLTIGFSIMVVYWAASELGISMPLLRLPV